MWEKSKKYYAQPLCPTSISDMASLFGVLPQGPKLGDGSSLGEGSKEPGYTVASLIFQLCASAKGRN